MPLPVDLNLITVTGSYADPVTGAPLSGLVTFYLAQPLTDTVGDVTLAAGVYPADVVNGSFSITLPCTDNASLNPTGFAYQVTEQVPGVYRSNTYQLPHTLGASVNIAQLVPVNPPTPYSTVYGILTGTQTWTGVNTFTGETVVPAPVNTGDAATKAYVDSHAGVSSVNGHTGAATLTAVDVTPYSTLGLVAQTFPIQAINHVDLGASLGYLICALIRPGALTITNLGLWLGTAGVTPNGVNQMGLYDASGTQLAVTGDMSTALSSAGNSGTYVEAPLTAAYAAAYNTDYYVALLCHMGTNPLIGGVLIGGGVPLPTVKGHRPSVEVSGQASLPASFNVSTAIAAPAAYWFAAS